MQRIHARVPDRARQRGGARFALLVSATIARSSALVLAIHFAAPSTASAEPPNGLRADQSPAATAPMVPDRVAIRFIAPETGGAARPRFLMEREIAFFARVEAMIEHLPLEGDTYSERYVRTAIDRLVVRSMLANLLVQRGTEPPDLARLTGLARSELEDRVGGAAVLDDALEREGLDATELLAFLQDYVRAVWYVDRTITPILGVTEDSLREAYRASMHPFRALKFEDARVRLRRWLVVERMRSAELEYLQSARTRIKIAVVPVATPAGGAKGPAAPGIAAFGLGL